MLKTFRVILALFMMVVSMEFLRLAEKFDPDTANSALREIRKGMNEKMDKSKTFRMKK